MMSVRGKGSSDTIAMLKGWEFELSKLNDSRSNRNEQVRKMTTAGRELARRKAKSDAELQKQRKEVEKLKSVLAVEQAKDKEASIRVHSIRKALRDGYAILICKNPAAANSINADRKLWMVFYAQIDKLQRSLRQPRSNENKNEAKMSQLQKVLADGMAFYSSLLSTLSKHASRVKPNIPASELILRSIYACLVALGDMARYLQLHSGQNEKEWSTALQYYYKAIQVLPNEGKAFNQLAVLDTYGKNPFHAAYWYTRALGCHHSFPARENLLSLLHSTSRQFAAIPPALLQALDRLAGTASRGTKGQHVQLLSQHAPSEECALFECCFLRSLYLLVSNIDIDTVPELLVRTATALQSVLGTLSQEGSDLHLAQRVCETGTRAILMSLHQVLEHCGPRTGDVAAGGSGHDPSQLLQYPSFAAASDGSLRLMSPLLGTTTDGKLTQAATEMAHLLLELGQSVLLSLASLVSARKGEASPDIVASFLMPSLMFMRCLRHFPGLLAFGGAVGNGGNQLHLEVPCGELSAAVSSEGDSQLQRLRKSLCLGLNAAVQLVREAQPPSVEDPAAGSSNQEERSLPCSCLPEDLQLAGFQPTAALLCRAEGEGTHCSSPHAAAGVSDGGAVDSNWSATARLVECRASWMVACGLAVSSLPGCVQPLLLHDEGCNLFFLSEAELQLHRRGGAEGVAREEAQDMFVRGQEAADKGDWETAVRLLASSSKRHSSVRAKASPLLASALQALSAAKRAAKRAPHPSRASHNDHFGEGGPGVQPEDEAAEPALECPVPEAPCLRMHSCACACSSAGSTAKGVDAHACTCYSTLTRSTAPLASLLEALGDSCGYDTSSDSEVEGSDAPSIRPPGVSEDVPAVWRGPSLPDEAVNHILALLREAAAKRIGGQGIASTSVATAIARDSRAPRGMLFGVSTTAKGPSAGSARGRLSGGGKQGVAPSAGSRNIPRSGNKAAPSPHEHSNMSSKGGQRWPRGQGVSAVPAVTTQRIGTTSSKSTFAMSASDGSTFSRGAPQAAQSLPKMPMLPLVVLDAPNIGNLHRSSSFLPALIPFLAMRHGLKQRFSCEGIRLAIAYWEKKGHPTVAFLPDYYLDYDYVGGKRRMAKLGYDVAVQKVPDNISLLADLVKEGSLILTPPQDHDDSYAIVYARSHGGYIVTNDMYRDHVKSAPNNERGSLRAWMRSHLISYTFVQNEFLPNPNFSF